jgi:hypothetical protein
MDAIYVLLGLVVLALVARFFRRGFRRDSTDLSGTVVQQADGRAVRLDELVDRPTLLVLVRYYG